MNRALREVDCLGRVSLPVKMRRELGFVDEEEVEILVDKDTIGMRKYSPKCIFCESETSSKFQGKTVCTECLNQIKNLRRD